MVFLPGKLMNPPHNDKIMVISGDTNFCYLMKRYAKMSAHQILLINLGDDILPIAQREKPSLIVWEVTLLDTVSWRTLRLLTDNDITRKIPLMICSWRDEDERSLKGSADICLHMPILYQDFKHALQQIFDVHQA